MVLLSNELELLCHNSTDSSFGALYVPSQHALGIRQDAESMKLHIFAVKVGMYALLSNLYSPVLT